MQKFELKEELLETHTELKEIKKEHNEDQKEFKEELDKNRELQEAMEEVKVLRKKSFRELERKCIEVRRDWNELRKEIKEKDMEINDGREECQKELEKKHMEVKEGREEFKKELEKKNVEIKGGMPIFHEPELKVLNSHGNIYPTALLPLLPKEVAEDLVGWLEGLLKHTVSRAVKRERRKGSSGSADSRGQSPEEESAEEGGPGERLPGVGFAKRNNTDVTTPEGVGGGSGRLRRRGGGGGGGDRGVADKK